MSADGGCQFDIANIFSSQRALCNFYARKVQVNKNSALTLKSDGPLQFINIFLKIYLSFKTCFDLELVNCFPYAPTLTSLELIVVYITIPFFYHRDEVRK